jgi:hypothetical protein
MTRYNPSIKSQFEKISIIRRIKYLVYNERESEKF